MNGVGEARSNAAGMLRVANELTDKVRKRHWIRQSRQWRYVASDRGFRLPA